MSEQRGCAWVICSLFGDDEEEEERQRMEREKSRRLRKESKRRKKAQRAQKRRSERTGGHSSRQNEEEPRDRDVSTSNNNSDDDYEGAFVGASAAANGRRISVDTGEAGGGAIDQELLGTFMLVLSKGLLISMHTSTGRPKRVRLWLEDNEIKWKAAKGLVRVKVSQLSLRDVLFIEIGKQTTNFARQPSRAVNEDLCFSLVTEDDTIDLETSSTMEREAMVQGFSLILGDLHDENES